MSNPKKIELKEAETKELLTRVKQKQLEEKDWFILEKVLLFYFWMESSLAKAELTIHTLRNLFGFKKDNTKNNSSKNSATANVSTSEEESSSSGKDGFNSKNSEKKSDEKGSSSTDNLGGGTHNSDQEPKKGHGRNKILDYPGAQIESIAQEDLSHDAPCLNYPECEGKLRLLNKPIPILITRGHAPVSAVRYDRQGFYCNSCHEYFYAQLPEEVLNDREKHNDRHGYSTISAIALQHYFCGMPFHRIETVQSLVGIPLSDSTQWDLMKRLYLIVFPVYQHLVYLAAQGWLIHHDDTSVKILSLMKENQEKKPERKGMFTTGILSYFEDRRIYLYLSGRLNAGENLDLILESRESTLDLLLQMSDASSSNKLALLVSLVCYCLSHARRKFTAIEHLFPDEVKKILYWFGKIYKTDDFCKKLNLSWEERLLYHQIHSTPMIGKLYSYFQELKAHENSPLGEAITYCTRYEEQLTRFLTTPGVPLDNNVLEQALKIPIRVRKESYFFSTSFSSQVAGVLTSVIVTSSQNGGNPIEYMQALQENQSKVAASPESWLPWNYKQQNTPSCDLAQNGEKVFHKKRALDRSREMPDLSTIPSFVE